MESGEQINSRPWLFKPGQSGNPSGRPKGSKSLKTYAQEMLRDMNEEERLEFLRGLDKKVIWEMAEGKPDAKTTATVQVDINNLKELPDDELDRIIAESTSGQG